MRRTGDTTVGRWRNPLRGLIAATALAFATLLGAPAEAVPSCGGQVHENDCKTGNIYPCCPNGGNCTWWAWESVCRHWKVALVNWGNANTWASHAKSDPKYDVLSYPVVNSIATRKSGNYGHVAWVTDISGSSVTVTEENCCTGCAAGKRTKTYPASYFDSGYVVRHGSVDCKPGKKETKDCGDCGSQSRTCGETGEWGKWGACDGPDPNGGKKACDTGEDGVCAAGIEHCTKGKTECVASKLASAELCDGLDNDCDGDVDDGFPKKLGAKPPAFAADLVDQDAPKTLAVGAHDVVTVDFRNVGSSTWTKGSVRLSAIDTSETEPSPFFAGSNWNDWDVPVTLDHDVPPGEVAHFTFTVTGPADAADTSIDETFQVERSTGELLPCPSPQVKLTIAVVPAPPGSAGAAGSAGSGDAGQPGTSGQSGTSGHGGEAGETSAAGSSTAGTSAAGASATAGKGGAGSGGKGGKPGYTLASEPSEDESCGCRAVGVDSPIEAPLALSLALSALAARRRRSCQA